MCAVFFEVKKIMEIKLNFHSKNVEQLVVHLALILIENTIMPYLWEFPTN